MREACPFALPTLTASFTSPSAAWRIDSWVASSVADSCSRTHGGQRQNTTRQQVVRGARRLPSTTPPPAGCWAAAARPVHTSCLLCPPALPHSHPLLGCLRAGVPLKRLLGAWGGKAAAHGLQELRLAQRLAGPGEQQRHGWVGVSETREGGVLGPKWLGVGTRPYFHPEVSASQCLLFSFFPPPHLLSCLSQPPRAVQHFVLPKVSSHPDQGPSPSPLEHMDSIPIIFVCGSTHRTKPLNSWRQCPNW